MALALVEPVAVHRHFHVAPRQSVRINLDTSLDARPKRPHMINVPHGRVGIADLADARIHRLQWGVDNRSRQHILLYDRQQFIRRPVFNLHEDASLTRDVIHAWMER